MRTPGYVSPAQAAARLGMSRPAVYLWARACVDGEASRLSGVKRTTGKYLLIPVGEVERLLREHLGL